MARTIGIIAIKGGVGKTTLSASLATDLVNHYGKKVLLIDANYSAPNLGIHMDLINPDKTIHDVLAGKARITSAIYNKFGVDILPGSYLYSREINYLKLRDRIKSIKKNYDFVIIDSSPSLNEELLSTVLASDNLFVVSTPDYPTLICSLRAAKLARQRGRPISGIVINKIRNPKYEVDLKEMEEITEIPVVAKIPDDPSGIKALFTRIPISVYNRKSKFSKEVSRLSAALIGKEEKIPLWKRILPSDFRREEVNRQILKRSFYEPVFESKEEKNG